MIDMVSDKKRKLEDLNYLRVFGQARLTSETSVCRRITGSGEFSSHMPRRRRNILCRKFICATDGVSERNLSNIRDQIRCMTQSLLQRAYRVFRCEYRTHTSAEADIYVIATYVHTLCTYMNMSRTS